MFAIEAAKKKGGKDKKTCKTFDIFQISSVESQKGIINIERCSFEALRTGRALSLYKIYDDSTLLVLNGTSLNNDSTLLALN